jgi:putative ABC transport system substrate-binding protein
MRPDAVRRALVLAGALVAAGAPQAREAPPLAPGGRPWRVGWLSEASHAKASQHNVEVFAAAMRDKGWVLGEHYVIDIRESGGDSRRFAALAAELVAAKPDLLIGIETTAKAYLQHTTTIPVVLWGSPDPVAAGLVHSLARPGTNVTGIAVLADALTMKNVEALFELVPQARRIVLLTDAAWSGVARVGAAAQTAARAKGAELQVLTIDADPASVRAALEQLQRRRPDGLVLLTSGAVIVHAAALRAGIVALKLPATCLTAAGAILRNGWSFDENLRESTEFVDRILRGAKPAELPVRQLMRVEVTLDLRTAHEIGVEVPASLRLRADRVIE